MARFTCTICIGFLGTFEHDLQALRSMLHAMDEGMNPERERVPPTPRKRD